jgi:hypothetical protein
LGKSKRGFKERTREQELKFENKEFRRRERDKDHQILMLKREVSSLRKQLARIDLDRYSHIRDIVEEHYHEEEQQVTALDGLKSLKEQWKCHECGNGYLEIYVYNRQDGTFYYRVCNNCPNRTKSQKYDPDTVQGIMKDLTKPAKNTK